MRFELSPASNIDEVICRVEARLAARAHARALLRRLEKIGRVAIFGGFVRDAAFGAPVVDSDVDFVVDCTADELTNALGTYSPTNNRFGGLRFSCDAERFDVWTLQSTWAIRTGLVASSGLASLPRTTFFDLDGIAFERQRSLYLLPDYFERLGRQVLGINLRENPDMAGCVTRARTMSNRYGIPMSAELRAFVVERERADSRGLRNADCVHEFDQP